MSDVFEVNVLLNNPWYDFGYKSQIRFESMLLEFVCEGVSMAFLMKFNLKFTESDY